MAIPSILDFLRSTDDEVLRELRRTCERFAESRLSVTAGEIPSFRRDDFSAMGEIGLAGASVPEQDGGMGLSRSEIATIAFSLARVQLGPAIYLSVHHMVSGLLAEWSRGEQRSLLPALASGEKFAAFCLTEASAGSDASALKTRAEKKGDSYILNGEKIYITSSGSADVYLVFARTSEDKKRGISAFTVMRDAPGITFGKPEKKMGCEGSPIANVAFENCVVPASQRIGEEGDGYRVALSGLSGGRVNIAACACGLASRAIELAVRHLRERKQFGQALAEFQGLQFMVADLYQLFAASVELTREAAIALDRGDKSPLRSSVAKCFATDSAMKITTDAVQLLGGAGYLAEYEVERLMRDAKMLQIVEGANQIQRVLIAREVFAQSL